MRQGQRGRGASSYPRWARTVLSRAARDPVAGRGRRRRSSGGYGPAAGRPGMHGRGSPGRGLGHVTVVDEVGPVPGEGQTGGWWQVKTGRKPAAKPPGVLVAERSCSRRRRRATRKLNSQSRTASHQPTGRAPGKQDGDWVGVRGHQPGPGPSTAAKTARARRTAGPGRARAPRSRRPSGTRVMQCAAK